MVAARDGGEDGGAGEGGCAGGCVKGGTGSGDDGDGSNCCREMGVSETRRWWW